MQLQQMIQLTPLEIQQYVQQHEQTVVAQLLENFGTPDAHMRESVCYQLFAYCVQENIFSKQSLTQILQHILAQRSLLHNIATEQSDAVFMRSTSALWLTLLVKQPQLVDASLYHTIMEQAIEALQKERDARGYINEEKGWADAIGVMTELCYSLVQHEFFELKQTAPLLQAITKTIWNGQVYTNNEDERFVKILMALIHRGIDEALFIEWVEQLFDRLEYYSYEMGYTQQWFMARTNLLHLMKTLYFHLKFSHQYEQLRATTSIFIQKWLKLS